MYVADFIRSILLLITSAEIVRNVLLNTMYPIKLAITVHNYKNTKQD